MTHRGLGLDMGATATLVQSAMQLAEALPLGTIERETRRHAIVQILERVPLPVGVLTTGSTLPQMTNAAWRRHFAKLPAALLERVRTIEETGLDQSVELDPEAGLRPAHYAAYLRVLRGCLGASTGTVVICSDVTEQVIARTLNIAPGTLVWGGPLGESIDYRNDAFDAYVGEECDWDASVHRSDRASCRSALERATQYGEETHLEARLRRRNGDHRWHRLQFVPVVDKGRWYGTAFDIHDAHSLAHERSELVTNARVSREDAESANRLKDEFIAVVSHELRAPVTTMLLWEKVLRDQHDPAVRAQALDAIRQSALAQSRLVGDLLDVSRAASGKLHVDLRPLVLSDVISAALSAALPAALGRRISLAQTGPRPRWIVGDMARLRQVLDNLLGNAIKFTEPGGSVTISTLTLSRDVVIHIEDTGRGIPEDLLERIFEPFHQTEDVLTRRHSGLGLGLAISRQLVQLHGGTLTAASPGVGRGSTLTIRLPLSHRQRTREPSPNVPPTSLVARRVLVIDDDTRVRDALLLLLQRAGAVVDTASSAAQGRERLEAASPELMICDIAMPGEDGYSFIRTLRASGCKIPAIALTAHAMEVDATRALAAGFDVHLAKPVHFERLVKTIRSLISTTRS